MNLSRPQHRKLRINTPTIIENNTKTHIVKHEEKLTTPQNKPSLKMAKEVAWDNGQDGQFLHSFILSPNRKS